MNEHTGGGHIVYMQELALWGSAPPHDHLGIAGLNGIVKTP
ncbi:hypothetical protein VITFI_CDS0681 [Vitreoscilla filiformis]|uniref:Uncharacterized protein n=1 Tax=Vitreoscilla filiformis TaxID=63 RepID=A0A221KC98_VITFI|nr:hypothetical protein VITFI_CDS0681 [Vitreoscilla filiformis]